MANIIRIYIIEPVIVNVFCIIKYETNNQEYFMIIIIPV